MASLKLRVRAASGGPTIRVQIPLLCSLRGLKDVLGPLISLPSSSFSLSLNKKDEIQGPGDALVSSFGVTSGDLLFYIVNSGGHSSFSGSAHLVENRSSRAAESSATTAAERVAFRESRPAASGGRASGPSIGEAVPAGRPASTPRELCAAAAARRAEDRKQEQTIGGSDSTNLVPHAAATTAAVISSSSSSSPRAEGGVAMEVEIDKRASLDTPPGAGTGGGGGHHLIPIPDLLHRVLTSEIGNIHQPSAYLVLAVHAVMLETGFVRVETGSSQAASSASEGYGLPSGWSAVGLVNLTYTLPELARAVKSSSSASSSSSGRALGEEAFLRCQIVGNAVVVYGVVTGGSVHRLSLSVSKFLRQNLISRKFAATGESSSSGKEKIDSGMEDVDNSFGQGPSGEGAHSASASAAPPSLGEDNEENVFRGIFELWKEVKDCLSLPLLTLMCEKAGLPPPPSLLRLPTELKVKVLDSLPSMALANISCACSELRFLAASEELWEQKYKEEFGASGKRAPGGRGWKSAFVREFENRKRREEDRREAERRFRAEVFPPGIILRPPPFSPHFGAMDYFQGLGAGPSRGGNFLGGFGCDVGGGGGFRNLGFRGVPSAGNHGAAFPSNWGGARLDAGVGGAYGDEDGVCFPGIDFDGRGVRAWPPVNFVGLRGTRSQGRLDGGGGGAYVGPVVEYPRRLDGGDFQGLGSSS